MAKKEIAVPKIPVPELKNETVVTIPKEVEPLVPPQKPTENLTVGAPTQITNFGDVSGIESEWALATDADLEKKALIQLSGMSGSGKTTTSLAIAAGILQSKYQNEIEKWAQENNIKKNIEGNWPELPDFIWKKIGFLDTEHKRSANVIGSIIQLKNYGSFKIGKVNIVNIDAPYTPARVINAKEWLLKKVPEIEILILDSATLIWEELKNWVSNVQKANPSGNGYVAWGNITDPYKDFTKSFTTDNSIHVILCTRAKGDVVLKLDNNGKTTVQKNGLKSDMKGELEYEFQVALMLEKIGDNHQYRADKDNTNIFEDGETINPNIGNMLEKWLSNKITQKQIYLEKIKKYMNIYGKDKVGNLKNEFCSNYGYVDKSNMPLKATELPEAAVVDLYMFLKKTLTTIEGVS